eukprot:c20789_g1_i1.p1 GENE.c20789_g1_i1~~c20789_g1_i1.p1  ORF type:complete len:225 (-),score=20.91 c20789_g1_i1:14-688(-)
MPTAINCTAVAPGGHVFCSAGDSVAGDSRTTCSIIDSRTARTVAQMQCDYCSCVLACAWHPRGNYIATGGEDKVTRHTYSQSHTRSTHSHSHLTSHGHTIALTHSITHAYNTHIQRKKSHLNSRIWDLRRLDNCVRFFCSEMTAVGSLRYDESGNILGVAETADFLHLYDVASGYSQKQVIDVFGEVTGFSFSPDSDSLFLGISDNVVGCIMEYKRAQHHSMLV